MESWTTKFDEKKPLTISNFLKGIKEPIYYKSETKFNSCNITNLK